MTRVYLKGLNVIIDAPKVTPRWIPQRAARVQPHDDNFQFHDTETKESYKVELADLQDADGNGFATMELAEDYVSGFIGGFNPGGGVGSGDAIVVGTVNTFPDLPDPAGFAGKYYSVQNGSGGLNLGVLGRYGGNDPGLYFSTGTAWELRRDIDATDILINQSLYAFTSAANVADALADIQAKFNSLDSVDGGSVTSHNDINDAGSGEVITDQERTNISGPVTVHDDVDDAGSGRIITDDERTQLSKSHQGFSLWENDGFTIGFNLNASAAVGFPNPIEIFNTIVSSVDAAGFFATDTEGRQVTFNFTGIIECWASIHVTSVGQRNAVKLRAKLNGNEVGPISSTGYIRAASGHNESSFFVPFILQVAIGDVLSIHAEREGTNRSSTSMVEVGSSQAFIKRIQ